MKSNCSESLPPRADHDPADSPVVTWLRWFANFGLSLSAVDCTLDAPRERDSTCPFAQLLKAPRKIA